MGDHGNYGPGTSGLHVLHAWSEVIAPVGTVSYLSDGLGYFFGVGHVEGKGRSFSFGQLLKAVDLPIQVLAIFRTPWFSLRTQLDVHDF